MLEATIETIRDVKPDVIITHNAAGEYGHREHILLHHVVLAAARNENLDTVLSFGHGATRPPAFSVNGDRTKKRALQSHYQPHWNGEEIYDFALNEEAFMRETLL